MLRRADKGPRSGGEMSVVAAKIYDNFHIGYVMSIYSMFSPRWLVGSLLGALKENSTQYP